MELSADRLQVTLGRHRVLDQVTVALAPGRVTVLLGPNGAGKSTLLRAMAGLVAPQAGQVTLDGRDVAHWPARERARTIGYLPQSGEVAWNMRARDVVALGRQPHRTGAAADQAAVAAALEATDAAALADRAVSTLSGGERARVLLARVLAGEPEWLLADEPLASLDPAHQLDILDRLQQVARGGAGVVIVLHDLLHAGRMADDVLLLKGGRVLASGETAAVLTPENLRAAFEIEVSVAQDKSGGLVCLPTGRVSR